MLKSLDPKWYALNSNSYLLLSSTLQIFITKRSWNRCAAHVHISHIIKKLELSKRQVIKEAELYESHQMRAHEGSKGGVLLDLHSSNGMKNGITSTVRNPHESKNIILQQQYHYRDTSKAAPTPVVYVPQKQVSLRLILVKKPTFVPSSSCTNDYHYCAEFQLLVLVSRK